MKIINNREYNTKKDVWAKAEITANNNHNKINNKQKIKFAKSTCKKLGKKSIREELRLKKYQCKDNRENLLLHMKLMLYLMQSQKIYH